MQPCTLNWTSDRGFELDLEAVDDDVALRLSGVAVPADGTTELEAGVGLDRLEILFKAHVDISGQPGQLVEATVTLSANSELEFVARIEDVETGELLDFKSRHPVTLPEGVPVSGGTRHLAASEDDLDWEDDTTLEKMIVNAPETTGADGAEPSDGEGQRGMAALLRALVSMDDPGAPEHAPTEPEVDIAAVLAQAAAPPEPEDQQVSDADAARGLLKLLVEQDGLEIEEGHDLEELVSGTVQVLAMPARPEAQASALASWLLDQPAVADLYVDDEDLAGILEQW